MSVDFKNNQFTMENCDVDTNDEADCNSVNNSLCPMKGCDGSGNISQNFSTHRSLSGCPHSLNLKLYEAQPKSDYRTCPTPGCDGSGNVKSMYTYHRSVQRCPIMRDRLEEYKGVLTVDEIEDIRHGKMPFPMEKLKIPGTQKSISAPMHDLIINHNGYDDSYSLTQSECSTEGNKSSTPDYNTKSKRTRSLTRKTTSDKSSPTMKKAKISNQANDDVCEEKCNNNEIDVFNVKEVPRNDNRIQFSVLNSDLNSINLSEEQITHLKLCIQHSENTLDQIQEREYKLNTKLNSVQKEIDQMKSKNETLANIIKQSGDIIIKACKEFEFDFDNNIDNGDQLDAYLDKIEGISQNNDKEGNTLFYTKIRNDFKDICFDI